MPRQYRKGKDSLSYDLRVRISAETAEALEAAATATFQTRAQLARTIIENHLLIFQQKRSHKMKIWLKRCPNTYNDYCTDMFLIDTEIPAVIEHVDITGNIAKRNGTSTNQTAKQTIEAVESEHAVETEIMAIEHWTAKDGYVYTLQKNGEDVKTMKLDDFLATHKNIPSSNWFAAAVANMI